MQRYQRRFYDGDENAGFVFFVLVFLIHDSGTDQSRAAGVTCKHTDRVRVCVKLPFER